MLKRRVLTALVLVPPFIAALFLLDSFWIAVLLGTFIALGAWEWTGLAAIRARTLRFAYTIAVVAIGGIAITVVFLAPAVAGVILGLASLWWLWMCIELAARDQPGGVERSGSGTRIAGMLILAPAWLAAVYVHHQDPMRPWALLYLFVLVWLCDTAAYFVGGRFGKTKLAPRISPGKSVEGLVAALGTAILLGYCSGIWIWHLDRGERGMWVVLAGVVALLSVAGDLVESKFKRLAGVKDSGTLLPGHGGVLDRIDAFTGAAPVYAIGWYVLVSMRP